VVKGQSDNFTKKIVICLLVFLLTFTGVVLWLFYATGGMEPTALVTAVFAATVGELGFLTFIRKLKSDEKEEDESEDTGHDI
jgi:hypothetical protein